MILKQFVKTVTGLPLLLDKVFPAESPTGGKLVSKGNKGPNTHFPKPQSLRLMINSEDILKKHKVYKRKELACR